MSRGAYLTVRDFRVWFVKRQGFLSSLRRAEPSYVKAVDGIDLDIGKGEVYCLVGESGCGKTTTGKGILRLVEPTGGDVFVDVPNEVLDQYLAARRTDDQTTLEGIQRRWSLAFREKVRWTVRDAALFLLMALAGTVLGGLVGGGIDAGLRSTGFSWISLIPMGIIVAFMGTVPWFKVTPRVPVMLGLFGILGSVLSAGFGNLFVQLTSGGGLDIGAAFAQYGEAWSRDFVAPLIQALLVVLALATTGESARLLMGYWQSRKGIEADKLHKLRKTLQIIFQDPYESLNPKHSVYEIVSEPVIVNHLARGRAETEARVEQALSDAGLRPPRDFMFRYPHELSGGQRQRVSIAGALVLHPEFIVADEPVSMLDVSIRTEILELLLELRRDKGLTYLFITHDLSLAWVLADRIGVMYLGKIVEQGPTKELIKNPRHPYTKALISVVPKPDPDRRRQRIVLKGERPDPSDIPPGCRFHPRCPVAFEKCGWTAHEVLGDLRKLAASEGHAERLGRATIAEGDVLTLEGEAEEWLRSVLATKSEEVRALKAIRSVERGPGGIRVLLHPYEEPALEAITGDVQVACHLFR